MILGMRPDLIEVVTHDPHWAIAFQEEAARIVAAAGEPGLNIEHIGSTSISGLQAKPIIDMMIGLPALADATWLIPRLEAVGYEYVPAFEAVMPERRYLRQTVGGRRTHQLHVVERGSGFWIRHLAFRDFLRVHPDLAQRYGQLKNRLAAQFPRDAEAYIDGKDALIKELETQALAWHAKRGGDSV